MYMAQKSYDSLVEALQQQELAAQQAQHEVRRLKHELLQQERLSARHMAHTQAVQVFSESVLGLMKEGAILELLCQTVVQKLKWDAAFVVEVNSHAHVRASFHATQKQLKSMGQAVETMPKFLKAYAHHDVITTAGKDDAVALALRTVLVTDEVAAVPILFGEHLFGYLIACAHTERSRLRAIEEVRFLGGLAKLSAHAVESARTLVGLEVQNEKLRKLDELKDSFISITSHQLRTPLSIVKWTLSLLDSDEDVRKLSEQHKMIEQAYVANERLIHVVNDLLNVSRIQDGKLPYSPQLADIRVLLHDVAIGMDKLCENKGVSLISRIDADVPLLQLDPILFKEAIQNLLDNALDYNQPEGGSIRLELSRQDGFVKVDVVNTGPGISKQELSTIFDQFYRSQDAIKMHPNGNGLGLYLSRAIIQQHGGNIMCESNPNIETIFTVTIPFHHAKDSHR
jgi:signal transduction histidine kinase